MHRSRAFFSIVLILLLGVTAAADNWKELDHDGGYVHGSRHFELKSEPQSGEQVVKTALGFLGVPYRWAGAEPTAGFDASGLVYQVYRLNGYGLPRSLPMQYQACSKEARSDLAPGDLVFFSEGDKVPSHVGVYVGDGQFCHASSEAGCVVLSKLDGPYRERFLKGGRIARNASAATTALELAGALSKAYPSTYTTTVKSVDVTPVRTTGEPRIRPLFRRQATYFYLDIESRPALFEPRLAKIGNESEEPDGDKDYWKQRLGEFVSSLWMVL